MRNGLGNSIKRSLVAAVVVSTLYPAVAMSQTLEQAVATTLDTNPELQQALSRFKVREEQANQVFGDYLPTVDLTAGYGWKQSSTPQSRLQQDGMVDSEVPEVGLSIRQTLFNGFATGNELSRLNHEAQAEQWKLFGTAEDIALSVVKVYINYLVEELIVVLAQKNVDKHQILFDQIKEKTESGLGSTADLSQSKGRLARAYSNLMSAENNAADARSEFIRVVNEAPVDVIAPMVDHDMIPPTLEQAITIAEKNHPIIKSANSDIDAARSERKAAKSNYYPEITLELGGQWSDEKFDYTNALEGEDKELQAAIQMRYNLFNGGKDVSRVREAAYKINEAKGVQQNTFRDVKDGTTLAWNANSFLGKQKDYIRTHVEASKETQSAYEHQFRLGQRSLLDLLDSENELFEARKSYLRAEFDELLSQYRILHATGQLLSSLRVTTPESWNVGSDSQGEAK
ncbi:TolC family outer membrane protein [Photobacterium leiognathi]|uniref:TolC family outer membrane protein n=1 Tax=Photobacterium leiognathi TaxID=553611 RepID=UPI000D172531|nr:TolC family outer membrane protein [Photobacterium leiognathi]PSW54665.1 channel protein TolC [Photobacterium leiognathi subsp. mandapamensis]